jgi:hypothetical protein
VPAFTAFTTGTTSLTVATFNDPVSHGGTADPPSHYTVSITWGDGSAASVGTVILDNASTGAYHVTGSHVYTTAGTDTVTVTIVDGSGIDSAAPTSTATVVGLNSVIVNANTAPILSLAVSGTTITVTTNGNTTFAAGQGVVIANSSVAADNGTYTVLTASSASGTFQYTDGNVGIANATGGTATVVGGTGSLGTGVLGSSQRSMVDSIIYTFATALTVAPTVTVTVHSGQTGTVPTVAVVSPDGGFTWVVTFSGSGTSGQSIGDGVYDVTFTAGATTRTDTFWRLFGDLQGTKTVNTIDRGKFNLAFGTSLGAANYQVAFDDTDSGTINTISRGRFNLNFGKVFSGFTATI